MQLVYILKIIIGIHKETLMDLLQRMIIFIRLGIHGQFLSRAQINSRGSSIRIENYSAARNVPVSVGRSMRQIMSAYGLPSSMAKATPGNLDLDT